MWLLSEAYPIANVSRFHENQQLAHVTWNGHGAELAVVDVLGRVSFYTIFLAVNHLNVTRHQILDQDDDLSALVGFWWLPVEKMVSFQLSCPSMSHVGTLIAMSVLVVCAV